MTRYADLEIGLRRRDDNEYTVQFRYRPPDSAAESRPEGGPVKVDLEALAQLVLDPKKYGQALSDGLFANPNVLKSFSEARACAEALEVPLRVRLLIDPAAAELYRVRWETLLDPRDGSYLCTDGKLYLSRYSLTADYRPVRLRLKSKLQALVMAANPTNLAEFQLEPIDVQGEIDIARRGLGQIHVTPLPEPESGQRASIDNLTDQLRKHQYDIVYLICHGSLFNGQSWLWLEGEDGKVARVSGDDFVERIQNLASGRPSLIVLASCQSADHGTGEVLSSLGPRLAVSGVPAVIAMQGTVSMTTVTEFMPAFFRELSEHGVIDHAMAIARERVQDRPDFWMPVLFMRLRDGSIWSGFSDADAFNKWPALTAAIRDKKLVPILGAGLVEPILGSLRQIAGAWAEEYHYPMFGHERDSLPQIAQYLADTQGLDFPKTELENSLIKKLQREHRSELPAKLLEKEATLDDIISALAAKRREHVPWDAYKVMAKLGLPIYVTANLNRVLQSALEEEGKTPHTLISPWNKYIVQQKYIVDKKMSGLDAEGLDVFDHSTISPDEPLVFHPFGRLNDPETVVLTEDEYFQYLVGIGKEENRHLLLERLPSKIFTGTLLFLGFQLVDWDLRVLLQTLYSFEGSSLLRKKKHIAVIQLDREGIMDQEGARNYLQERLQNWSIYMYLGSPEDFVYELLYYLPTEEGGRQS